MANVLLLVVSAAASRWYSLATDSTCGRLFTYLSAAKSVWPIHGLLRRCRPEAHARHDVADMHTACVPGVPHARAAAARCASSRTAHSAR